jgi:dynein heavy chain
MNIFLINNLHNEQEEEGRDRGGSIRKLGLWQEGKTKRYMAKLEKFKDYEDRLNNHQIIDEMIKGNKKEYLIPRSGEFFVLKSKEYEDPSLALRIPIGELLDGTKTHSELQKKYSKQSLAESEYYSSKGFPMRHSRLMDVRQVELTQPHAYPRPEGAQQYDTKLTTDLRDITGVQQAKYLTPSSVLFSDLKNIVSSQSNSTLVQQGSPAERPISAQVLVDKAKNFKTQSVRALEPAETAKDNISEMEAVDTVTRSKVDVRTIKKNTYQIKCKNQTHGIQGYRAQKVLEEDIKEEIERERARAAASRFSPFLMYPMNEAPPMEDIFDTQQKKSNNLFSLEYFMFPEHLDADDILSKWKKFKSEGEDGRVYGYTKYYDNHGGFEWKRCECLNFDPTDDKFTVKFPDKMVTKIVTRSNFYFESENKEEFFRMLNRGVQLRELSCTFMRYIELINKMTSPINPLQDKVKDRVTLLVMNNHYKLKPPRDPVEREKVSAKERFNCGDILRHPSELSIAPNYEVVKDFQQRRYDLKFFNKLTDEIDYEFVRANHQIEFDNSLPYNDNMQRMFRGVLDESLFEPLHIQYRRPAPENGLLVPLSADKHELQNYLKLYKELKGRLHCTSDERIAILGKTNEFLEKIRSYCFVMETFDKGYDIETFMANQTYSSNHFFRETQARVLDINDMLFNIVVREMEDMKNRNLHREKTITVESERISLMEKELPKEIVRMIHRFILMLNFKFEYYIKEAMRSSMIAYNKSFKNITERFERMLNYKPGTYPFEAITYQTVLDYQHHMQYQKHSQDCPLVLLKMTINNGKIVVDEDFTNFKARLKAWFEDNIRLCRKIECLNNKEIGAARLSRHMRIIETELELIESQRLANVKLIDQTFSIVETFLKRAKQFEFLFDENIDKLNKTSFSYLKNQILEIKRSKEDKEVVFFRDKLQTGMFMIDCSDIRVKLDERIKSVITNLITLLISKISSENDKLAKEIEDIENKLSAPVETFEELEEARNYATNIDDVLKDVMTKIRDIMGKMSLVEDLQYHVPFEDFKTAWKSFEFPGRVRARAKRSQARLDRREKELVIILRQNQEALDRKINDMSAKFARLAEEDNLANSDSTGKEFDELFDQIKKAQVEAKNIQNAERITNQQKLSEYLNLQELQKQFTPYFTFWEHATNLKYKYKNALELPIGEIKKTDFTEDLNAAWTDLFRLEKNDFKYAPHMMAMAKKLREEYGKLKPFIPLVSDLKNESLKIRQWKDILSILKLDCDVNEISKVSFQTFLDHGAMEARDQIKDISEIASKETSFQRLLASMKTDWKGVLFGIQEFRNTGKWILKAVEEITDKLDEDIAKLSSVLTSPYVKFLENDIVAERNTLIQNQEIIDVWVKVQKHWQYLQPIFSSEDIIKQRPTEATKFASIQNLFVTVMENTRNTPSVPEACKQQKLFENLCYCFSTAEDIIKSLNDYLNQKRQAFPRFYFLPNEELLTILAQTKEVRMIQKFLNKCFEGIETLTFTTPENIITKFNSIAGESLTFKEQIDPFEEPGVPRNVEEWLTDVEKGMKETLKEYFTRSFEAFSPEKKDSWLFEWPAQIVLVVGQTLWTYEVETALMAMPQNPDSLKNCYKAQRDKLMHIVKLIQKGNHAPKDTTTLEVLIVLEVHGLDVIEDLQKNKIEGKDFFEWTSQLRYYWDYNEKEKAQRLSAKMIITERAYGWEYLGNQGRLVITPLTDRCYRTLMSALHMNLGGAPEGPAGTGKTETTKDLAKALAKHCVVFNCSDELEIGQMSKFFMGLTSCGSWACFDEFNRIVVDVLSVIAQQILQIQTAILRDSEARIPAKEFQFAGSIVKLDSTCAVFITMNPGYAGRSELPDNLKRLFRSIAMMIPNYSMIAEISLYSYGYQEARNLATKIVQSLKLSSEQLSTQSHYDFGMRSVKTILTAAGNLKREFGQENESSLIIRAICDCTFPKFTSEDIPLFNNILEDLFPGQQRMNFDYGNIELGIKKAAKHYNLVLEDSFHDKIIQLYETIRVRHGLMVVGEPFAGKSSIMKTLKTGWELGDRIQGLRRRLEREASTRAREKKEKKLSAGHRPIEAARITAMAMLRRKSTIVLDEPEKPEKPAFDDKDPEYLSFYNEYYQSLLEELEVETLLRDRAGLGIQIDRLNPKAISPQLLYGVVDESSGDWKEGIAAKIFKDCSEDQSGHLRWITFDGPVDAVWIENMNTVLDDNKKLCLANSEQIKLTTKMSIVFEVEDLAEASLATVSRCGMVFMEAKQLNKKNLFYNWYLNLPPPYKSAQHLEFFEILYNHLIEAGFSIMKDENISIITKYSEHHMLVNVLRYFQGLLFKGKSKAEIYQELEIEKEKQKAKEEEARLLGLDPAENQPKKREEYAKGDKCEALGSMIFAIVWGMASSIDSMSRDYFSKLLGNEIKNCFLTLTAFKETGLILPDFNKESLFDLFYSFESKTWVNYMNLFTGLKIPADAKFSEIFIPTKDSIRNNYLMKIMVKQEFPFLLFGKTGTAKTQVIKKLILEELDQTKYIPLITVLSANTKREQLQDVLESKLEKQKRAKGIYGPLMGTKNIIFIDDLNMPNKEKYSAQPPLELIRQAIDEQGWYDRKALEFKTIVDIQFLAAMGLGRPNIPNRLNRHFTTVQLFEYDEETIKYVFKTILDHGFATMPEKVKTFTGRIVNICVQTYKSVCKSFKPLPGKSHYLFNLRDLSKVIQGVLSVSEAELTDNHVNLVSKFAKLITYESKRVFSDRFVDTKDKQDFVYILKPIIAEYFQEPFDKLVPSEEFFVFGNFMDQSGAQRLYKEINSLEAYKNIVKLYIDEYNEINKRKINILLFEECLDNLAKLNRILSREYGHALQIGLGGDGRRTLTRLATWMQGYDLQEMEIQKDIPLQDWQDFLREVFRRSGIKNNKCTILVTDSQLSKDIFYEDINNLLNIGEVPNLFKADDKEAIISDLKTAYAKAGKRNLSNLQAWEVFLTNCKSNLHLVLCASPIGDNLRLRLRNFPSLVNCSSILWYLPWTNDSLKIIGMDALAAHEEGKDLILGKESDLIDIFVDMHQIIIDECKQYYKEMKKYVYVTPLNYRIMLQNFTKLLAKKQVELQQERSRYFNGVKKLDEGAEFVEKTKKILQDLAPQLKENAKLADAAFIKVDKETHELAEIERVVSKEKAIALEKQQISQKIADQCDAELSQAKPVLERAKNKVSNLDKNFLVIIKSFKEPPAKAIIILEGVLRLFGHIPKKTQDSNTFFKQTIKKELFNVDEFLNKLKTFNVELVSEATIKSVTGYIAGQKLFTAETAKTASEDFLILYEWVVALLDYYNIYQSILPLRENLKKAEESLEEANQSLAKKEQELKVLQDKMEISNQELQKIQNEQAELSKKMKDCEVKLNRSLELNEKLSGERGRWESQVEILTQEINNILGDIVLACGYLSYLGPFTLDFRKKIVLQRWIATIDQREVPNSKEKFSLQNSIGNPIHIQDWNLCGLPFDATSIENVLIMKAYTDKFPLVLDPQSQFLKFIRTYEKKHLDKNIGNSVLSIKASLEHKEMERALSNAIRRGDILVIESVGENISSLFDDLLAGQFTMSAGMLCVQIGAQSVEIDKNFKLYMVSNLNSPHYTPELLSRVVYLDFSITPTGLQQQMVSLVCKTEEPKDEEEKIAITKESIEFQQKQKDLELKILRLLTDSKGNLVENDALINSLNESKATSEDIKARLKQSAKTEEKIEKNRQSYKPLATLISNIYLIIKDMYKLDPMYQFSLKWYENVVVKTIHSVEKPTVKNVDKRVVDLKEAILKSSYVQICRSIFVKHKQLISFLLAVTLLKTEDKLDFEAWNVMLTEKCRLIAPVPTPAAEDQEGEEATQEVEEIFQPSEINNVIWRKIEEISKLPQFTNLKKHAAFNPTQFLDYVDKMDSRNNFEAEIWPQEILTDFSQFNCLVFIKLFRPDLFPTYAKEFVKSTLSQYFNEEVIVPLEKTYEESNPITPFIYILSPGDDPQEEIKKFAQEKNAFIMPISLGRGQGEQAEKTINESCLSKSWVLLQNCHLALSWLPNLERIIEDMATEKRYKTLDPNFRLFLTAVSTDGFPISILQNGIKLTKDPPKGVKANMLQIYMNQNASKQEKKFYDDMIETRVEDWKPLFMALAYFHSVIRERRRFGPVGWNIPYDFNESDFKISVKQLKFVLNSNPPEIPFKALIYLTSECYYGGKVTDNQDRRLLTTLLKDFYNTKAIKEDYYFSENRDYCIPLNSMSLQEAIEYISGLPDVNEPGIYGLNSNASISSAINDTTIMVEAILAINPSSSKSSGSVDTNTLIKAAVSSVLKKVPENIDLAMVKEKYPIAYDKCMNTVLIQEVLRYNTLLSEIKTSSQDLINACEGTIVMTGPLEEMADKVQKNQIPTQWSKKSYPSLKPMVSYIEDLGLRIKMFNEWINKGQPKIYWVPGFFFTQSFFTGVLQDYARKYKISIDGLEFVHHVMHTDFDEKQCEPEGCYTKGLYLEAARYDCERNSLQESIPKRVFFDMPVIYFKPQVLKSQEEDQSAQQETQLDGSPKNQAPSTYFYE